MSALSSTPRRIVVVGGLLLLWAALPQAHTKLEKSEPAAGAAVTAAPKEIQLWFNEKIDLAVSKIELTSPSGKVELGPTHSMGDKTLMAAISGRVTGGTYTVAWQTAGDDGHLSKGDFTFTVRTAH
jgi:methionine-rich copper-binding protein CopC